MQTKIAIVGLGGLFPGARNVTEFWQNILSKKVSIQPLPEEQFESAVFYRPELFTAFQKGDKSVTKIAGWIEGLHFDSVKKYKIPPSVAEHMDSNQHAALYTTGQALEMNSLREVSKDRVAVIFGNGMVGTRYGDAMFRVQFQLMEYYLRQHRAFQALAEAEQNQLIEYLSANLLKDTIPISEDSAPGVLPNLIAGRIANVYDFHGPSFTVDAACASVLAAVITGIQGLQLKQYDAVICGGSDMPLKQLGFVLFSALNALSPDGSYPFDQAVQNQDTIYAVITGYGQASDGKGKYIAAPNADWQARVIEDACRMAGYPVDTIEMVEAHGTATKVGDVVEVAGLKQAFNRLGVQRVNYCGLTSVKSNIGHLKSAAGIAGLVKAVLSIYNHKLPPTANFESINPRLELEGSPFYILDEVREWEARPEHPRRANVSSFGFGGADYHLALEEYRPDNYRTPVFTGFQIGEVVQKPKEPERPANLEEVPASGEAEGAIFFAAPTLDELDRQAEDFLDRLQTSSLPFGEICSFQNFTAHSSANYRLAILANSATEFSNKLGWFIKNRENLTSDLLRTKGVYFKQGAPVTPAEIAILFPGQASQYPNMLRFAYQTYDTLRTWLRKADAYWHAQHGNTISGLIFPDGISEEQALEQLRQTHHAHPSIFITSYALYDLLTQMGLQASYMIGHSLGEITALAAAGKVTFENALKLIEQRGMAFHQENLPDPGQMLSLAGRADFAEQLIGESGCAITIANLNSPGQTIVAGRSPEIQRFKKFLDEKKLTNKLLYVSHAFHTSLLQPVADRFYNQIQAIPFHPSTSQVMMNQSGEFYKDDDQSLAVLPQLLREQILQPVNFMAGIQRLYREGVRLFVEVGPNSILSNLVKEILADQPVTVLAANYRNTNDLTCLQKLFAGLFVEGVPIQPVVVKLDRQLTGVETTSDPRHVASRPVEALPALPAAQSSPDRSTRVKVVYSGAAIGLPGSYKDTFRDDNFDQLFAGRNMIERLTDTEKQLLVDLQITKLVKDESGPSFQLLTSLDDVIQLAGKIGRIDLIRDYQIDEKIIQNMTSCIANGVAAGYEALKDAQIPLLREYSQTTTGKWLPQKLALPPTMQDETGVIFANGFPLIDPVIHEVSRHISYVYGSKLRKELMAFYESIIGRVKDDTARKLLSDWYTLYYGRLSDQPGQEEVYRFNHHFMTQISAQANNLLAFLLNARGPNFQLNAACSSTSNAITIAEDFIRSGRVQRMIVVGADDPSSKTNFPVLGAGFLCTGAATNEGDLYQAAVPFDRRRNGMIVGAGAVGLVIETQSAAEQRGVQPICELLGTHSFNTAKHISQIDSETFARELDRFISRMEQEYGLQREQLARQTVYLSHETYTPPRGGCSQTEAYALKRTFGDRVSQIIVGNTKGMTGHTMGASLEDAVAAKSLQFGKCPPVVNFSQPDPQLAGLQLWKGGSHDRRFALKMSAGFGAQGHFALLQKICTGEERIVDPARYRAWLQHISDDPAASVELHGRILTLKDHKVSPKDKEARPVVPGPISGPNEPAARLSPERQDQFSPVSGQSIPAPSPSPSALVLLPGEPSLLAKQIVEQLAAMTGYPPEMLEPEMEFAADLGIVGDRLVGVQSGLAGYFGLPRVSLSLTESQTVGQVIEQVSKALAGGRPVEPVLSQPPQAAASLHHASDQQALVVDTLKLFSEVTKYPEEMLELDMEMEADLGIDTVKQATIRQSSFPIIGLFDP
ncbi:MAG: acyltransferase domain-containing protein [Anaerolineales bacterium]|nr:acyltransferase domain-containing protein [Anaerolineales bacterium]